VAQSFKLLAKGLTSNEVAGDKKKISKNFNVSILDVGGRKIGGWGSELVGLH